MKSSAPAEQTVTQKTTNPEWVSSESQAIMNQANATADNLANPYSGQRVADTTADTNQAYAMTRAANGMAQPGQTFAQNTLNGAQNWQNGNVTAGQLSNTNLSPYMNPFAQNVINSTMATNQQALQGGLLKIGDQAAAAGAYGGSRQGTLEGAAVAQNALGMGNIAAQLNSQNFSQAQGAATNDINRTFMADQGNQSANQAAQNSRIQSAIAGGQNAANQQNSALQSASAMQSIGTAQQAQQQAQLDAQKALYDEASQRPLEQLGIKTSTLGQLPYDTTKTTTGPAQTQSANPLMQLLGGASSGAGLAGSLFPDMAGAKGLGAGVGGLFGLLGASDRDLKTDIQKVGKDPQTGIALHAYRYKGDPKNTTKVVSAMAQDVEKRFPGSTKRSGPGGMLAVDTSKLPAGVAQRLGFGGPSPAGAGGLLGAIPTDIKIVTKHKAKVKK